MCCVDRRLSRCGLTALSKAPVDSKHVGLLAADKKVVESRERKIIMSVRDWKDKSEAVKKGLPSEERQKSEAK